MLGNPFRHQIALMLDKADLAIQTVRTRVRPFDFEMQRADTERTTNIFGKGESPLTDSLSAMTGAKVHFVDKCVASAVFQTVAEREH